MRERLAYTYQNPAAGDLGKFVVTRTEPETAEEFGLMAQRFQAIQYHALRAQYGQDVPTEDIAQVANPTNRVMLHDQRALLRDAQHLQSQTYVHARLIVPGQAGPVSSVIGTGKLDYVKDPTKPKTKSQTIKLKEEAKLEEEAADVTAIFTGPAMWVKGQMRDMRRHGIAAAQLDFMLGLCPDDIPTLIRLPELTRSLRPTLKQIGFGAIRGGYGIERWGSKRIKVVQLIGPPAGVLKQKLVNKKPWLGEAERITAHRAA